MFDETTGRMTTIDWSLVVLYVVVSVAIGVILSRRARTSLASFFTSGGKMPWYLLGTSMVATTFAADTPLAISGFVFTQGISGNWFWWNAIFITMLGVFFYARLWRRANLTTDTEFVDIRYSGKPARFLRGFRAIYFSLIYSAIIMGWVNLAMVKIVSGILEPTDFRIETVDRPLERLLVRTGFLTSRAAEMNLSAAPGWNRAVLSIEAAALSEQAGGIALLPEGDRERALSPPDELGELTLADLADWLDTHGVTVNFPGNEAVSELSAEKLLAGTYRLRADGPTRSVRVLLEMEEHRLSRVLTVKLLFVLFLVTISYCAVSGFWGVVATDFIQFFIAMSGAIYLAIVAASHFGGMQGLIEAAKEGFGEPRAAAMMTMVPFESAADLRAAIELDPGSFDVDASISLMTMERFLIYVLIFWWAIGFTDGGAHLAQRMIGARSERDAAVAYLWYGVAHFCLRMWPWVVVGLAGVVLFPNLAAQQQMNPGAVSYDPEMNYIYTMRVFLGPGLLGLVVASFFAAYMSTISTHVNLSASYLVNDFYKAFLVPGRGEKHYVWASTIATILVAAVGITVTLFLSSIAAAWFLFASLNAGIGLVYLLRWYWWRISAWSELGCFAALITATLVLQLVLWGDLHNRALDRGEPPPSDVPAWYASMLEREGMVAYINRAINMEVTQYRFALEATDDEELLATEEQQEAREFYLERKGTTPEEGHLVAYVEETYNLAEFPLRILFIVPFSILVWLGLTLLTKPTDVEKLKTFYRQVRPGGPGWRHIAKLCPDVNPADSPLNRKNVKAWLVSVVGIYTALFGSHQMLFGSGLLAIVLFALTIASAVYLYRFFGAKQWVE